jgi:hypothetical protein
MIAHKALVDVDALPFFVNVLPAEMKPRKEAPGSLFDSLS